MKTVNKLFIVPLASLLLATALSLDAAAAGPGFSVAPGLPENQREGVSGYFDLTVQPGADQQLAITVSNSSEEEIVLSAEACTAATTQAGTVSYAETGLWDETLQHRMEDLIQFEASQITVAPGTTKELVFTLKVPAEGFDGILLGGVNILKELSEAELNSGQAIINQYAYVVPIKLQQNDTPVNAEFILDSVQAESVHFTPAVVCNIRNPQPKLLKGVTVKAQVFAQGSGEPVVEFSGSDLHIAPNSIFPLSLLAETGTNLGAGEYTAKIQIQYEDKDWNLEQTFQIQAEQAADMKENIIGDTPTQTAADSGAFGKLPGWAFVVIGAGVVLLIIGIVLALLIRRSRKQDIVYMQQLNEMHKKFHNADD